MKSTRFVATAIAVGVINICAAPHAHADPQSTAQAGGSEQSASEANALAEVVVTANRRQENSQSVPITVEAISGDTAASFGVTDMQSLANSVPGLRVDRGTATALPFIRGVGSPVAQVSAEPSVAIYVDDVYTPASGAALANFNSVSTLEVEKGPQGTLFGRNATGGVIQVNTRNPSDAPALDMNLGYASYDTPSGSMYATGALTQGLSANVSLYGSDQGNGWGHNLTTGESAFKDNRFYGGRIKLLWTPSEKTSVLLTLDHDDTKSSEGFYRPQFGTVGAGFYPAPAGFYDLVDHTNPYWDVKQGGVSLKVMQDIDWARLVSISAYRSTEQEQYFDQSGAPIPLVVANLIGPDRTITQEFQLLSPENSPFTWIGGFFFMHDASGYDPLGLSGAAVAPLIYASSYTDQITKSYAGFAQATWAIVSDTHLTAGIRYTRDQREIDANYILNVPVAGLVPGTASNSPQSASWSKPSGRLSLDHEFLPDLMGYISYNRGFKSGTFNAVVTPGSTIGPPVQPETLDDYSFGEKAEFFDHRLRLNSEAFWYAYKNIQVTRIVAGGTALSNAARATIKGLDVDAAWVATDHLTLTAGIELLDGHYDSYPGGVYWIYAPNPALGVSNVNPAVAPNLAGNKTIYTPPFSMTLKADYVYPTSIGDLDLAVSYNHSGDYYFDPDNGKGQLSQSLDRQPLLNLVDASLAWRSLGGRYDVRAWGKNITGQKYISFGFEEALLTQFAPAPPATYGITFGVHFK
jgi:iron complex outermembrane receptor protein